MAMQKDDLAALVKYSKENLDLSAVESAEEYGYASLPLCVIDAVFSIGARYASTENTVARFCKFFRVPQINEAARTNRDLQLSISELISYYAEYSIEGMADKVYQNRQRTSTINGILKSDAVLRFSEVLLQYDVDYLQDASKILGDTGFETKIQEIPGQRSGISLRYFYMLAGSEDFIKPDRMINRFVYQATGKMLGIEETTELLVNASGILAIEYPGLTPRTLDHIIWEYQRAG